MSEFESVVAAAMAGQSGGDGGDIEASTGDEVVDSGDGDGGEEIASSGSEGVEGGEDAAPGEGDEAAPAKTKTDDEPVDDNDPIAKELGVKKGKDNPIPYSRVKKIVPNLVAKELEPVAKVLGVDLTKIEPAKRGETFVAHVTETVQERDFLRGRVKAMDDVAPIMQSDATRFIGVLAKLFPEAGYGEFLNGRGGEGGGAVAPEKKTPLAADDPEPMPDQPVDLGNGVKGKVYSMEGHRKHTEWLRREIKRENEAMLNDRFAPLDKAQKAREEAQREIEDRENFVVELIQDAREWEGFKENEKEIQNAIGDFPKVPLKIAVRKAYEKVVLGKFRGDYASIRAQVLKEMDKAPSTGAGGGGAAPRRQEPSRDEDGNVDTSAESIVRQAVAQAKNRGAR